MKKPLTLRAIEAGSVAVIFEDVGGYHTCDYAPGCPLWTGGGPTATKSEAMRQAWIAGYTHATGSGTYWDGIRAIPIKCRDLGRYATVSLSRAIECAEWDADS